MLDGVDQTVATAPEATVLLPGWDGLNKKEPDGDIRALSGPELVRRYSGPVEFAVAPILRSGTSTLLAAPPRAGKSWLALGISLHVALGRNFGSFLVTRPRSVLIFSAEDDPSLLATRLRQLSAGLGVVTPGNLHFAFEPFKVGTMDGEAQIQDLIETRQAEIVVFDTLAHFHNGNENEANSMTAVMERFTMIARRTDCALLLLHHHRKGKGARGSYVLDRSRGSSTIVAACPVVITGGSLGYTVHSKYGEVPDFAVDLKRHGGESDAVTLTVTADQAIPGPQIAQGGPDKVLQAITELAQGSSPGGLGREEIAAAAGVSHNTVVRHLDALLKEGAVTSKKYGKKIVYQLTVREPDNEEVPRTDDVGWIG